MNNLYKLIAILFVACLFLSACTGKKKMQHSNEVSTSDSTRQKQINRTINRKLIIPRDSLIKEK